MQERTFCKWYVILQPQALWLMIDLLPCPRLNTKLEMNGYPAMTSLVKDLSDGVRLIQLMVRARLIWPYLESPTSTTRKSWVCLL